MQRLIDIDVFTQCLGVNPVSIMKFAAQLLPNNDN
ncbi:Uncharacterised protein [Vibrio cholerae]|nr:Uncharacterised protein [Vibrio cholerae]